MSKTIKANIADWMNISTDHTKIALIKTYKGDKAFQDIM